MSKMHAGKRLSRVRQHKRPCFDCPFRRKALPGWLGGNTPEVYASAVLSDQKIDCHVFTAQCAGAAILRGNVCKDPRSKDAIVLPPDRVAVFGDVREFLDFHKGVR